MRILIVRLGAMGDILHTLPAAAALRRERPDWRIDWVVDERWTPLLLDANAKGPIVDAIHIAPIKAWASSPLAPRTFGSIRALRRTLRASPYDLCIDAQGAVRSAVIGKFAKAPRFAGCAVPREPHARFLYGIRIDCTGTHVAEQSRTLLAEATGVPLTLSHADTFLPTDPAAEAWAASLTGSTKFCVMAPLAGWGAKQWPAARFGALAAALAERGIATFVNAISSADPLATAVVSASNGAAQAVPCDLSQLASLLRRASLFVGGDSGPTHMAALLGVPIVALYGPTDPVRNGPWGGAPCRILRHASSTTSHKRVEEIDRGLARIEVSEALAAAEALLALRQ